MSKISIDNEEYKFDDLSDKARSYAEHCHDLQRKIVNAQKDLEQLVTAKIHITMPSNRNWKHHKRLSNGKKVCANC